ncbi:MAG: NAD(P)/FAD-dependent oxidoreductase [Clostridiales bacterium]|nr:NAD(P)/FAD-dependent oxidoreductase [Clostridiales bacterium]
MHIVIIGNSAAAVGCIEGIRKNNQEADITVISNETHHTYSRPLISYLLYGKTDEQRMKYRPDSFYEENRVTAVLGKSVVRIDKDNKKVELDDGQIVAYDKLLVATGSKPFVPPMKGLDSVEKQFTFMTLNDAKALEAALFPSASVLVVGAGLIGLKCVEGIRDKVASVTVVDMADRILPSILDAEGSALVQKSIEQKGVKFILSNSVKEFKGNTAFLTNDDILNFDIVVVAVGVRPNVELVKEIGGDVNRGIITDERCHTSIPDIYAAGDCTESYDITVNQHRILALLPNAYMQGESAGYDMVGASKPYDKAIPMNAIGFFGYHIITAGSYDGEAYVSADGDSYKKLVVKDGVLKGYILIGDVRRAGIYTKLIREQVPLDTIDFELIKEKPQLMAFAKAERAKQLAGVK